MREGPIHRFALRLPNVCVRNAKLRLTPTALLQRALRSISRRAPRRTRSLRRLSPCRLARLRRSSVELALDLRRRATAEVSLSPARECDPAHDSRNAGSGQHAHRYARSSKSNAGRHLHDALHLRKRQTSSRRRFIAGIGHFTVPSSGNTYSVFFATRYHPLYRRFLNLPIYAPALTGAGKRERKSARSRASAASLFAISGIWDARRHVPLGAFENPLTCKTNASSQLKCPKLRLD